MSLEQQVTALVASANALTGAVDSKIGEIDQKVNQSVEQLNNAFPIKYKEFATRKTYVDCVNGNDANSGESWGLAVRTLGKALTLGESALLQVIYLSKGIHIISTQSTTLANIVNIEGDNQNHHPDGNWSEATSSIIKIDKTATIRAGIDIKLFGGLFVNSSVISFFGRSDDTSDYNTAFFNRGNLGLRVPLFVFDSANRGIIRASNDYNPFSSLGAELPQLTGTAGFYVKGNGSTCILNLDRTVDRTSGMIAKSGSVVLLS